MGIIRAGNYGEFTGKVGNLIVYFWHGKRVVRSRPTSVFNPNTEQQQQQRGKFGLVMGFIRVHKQLVKIGFKPWAKGMSAYNAAMSYNLANAVVGEVPNLSINFEKALISRGDLLPVANLRARATAPGTLLLEWQADRPMTSHATAADTLMVAVYSETDKVTFSCDSGAERSAGSAKLQVPGEYAGKTVQVFAFFIAAKAYGAVETKKQVSNSVWAGSVELA